MSVDRIVAIWLLCVMALGSVLAAGKAPARWAELLCIAAGAAALTVAIWLGRQA